MGSVLNDDALQSYLNNIKDIPIISKEEEVELAIKAKNGDQEAKNKLVTAHLKFVVKIAAGYQKRGLTLLELISEGNVGLIEAINRFEPDKGIKLISYAVWWIRQAILAAIIEKSSIIKTPLARSNAISKIKNIRDRYTVETGEEITNKELSEASGISEKLLKNIHLQNIDTYSIDEVSRFDGGDTSLLDYIEDASAEDPKDIYYKERLQKQITNSIESLDKRGAHIIKSYYGLDGKKGKNFAEIAQEMGISRERVRQIQKQALKKIVSESYSDYEKDIDYLLSHYDD
ncbi:MAG: RNA polymerase sigma factor RpoD/SigA [Candidatus Cloacimonadales bacterium]|jgi:RNA polymerase primary sigma factor|nr:RNA polymerase sigma factor RpoD/SigA [Candidatus Cloacimonadota bacterium]MDD2650411.1 RNA polymerase sigma factor RpoD/SigA [Candidatus Cloacimonadota bacterium]MDX9977570.1 RNA polymerase sigma factor RpoD/SigA [Candidatus Cloacimonadales bacterium]